VQRPGPPVLLVVGGDLRGRAGDIRHAHLVDQGGHECIGGPASDVPASWFGKRDSIQIGGGFDSHPARRRLLGAQELACGLFMPPLQRRVEEALERLALLADGGPPVHSHLSARERQVLGLVASGLTNQAVAAELSISPNRSGEYSPISGCRADTSWKASPMGTTRACARSAARR